MSTEAKYNTFCLEPCFESYPSGPRMRLNGENIIQFGFILAMFSAWLCWICIGTMEEDMKRHRVDSGYEVQDEDGEQPYESDDEESSEEGDIHMKVKNATEEIIEQLWLINHTIIDTFRAIEGLIEENPNLSAEQTQLLENLAEIHSRILKSIKYGLTMNETATTIAEREAPENKYTYMKFKDDLAAGVYSGHEGKYVVVDEHKQFVRMVGSMTDAIAIITAPDAKGMTVYKIPGVALPFSPSQEPSVAAAVAEPVPQPVEATIGTVSVQGVNVEINGELLRAFRSIVGEVQLPASPATFEPSRPEVDFNAVD